MDDLFGDDAWGEEPDWVKLGADHRSSNTEGGQQEENDGTASPMVLGAQHVLLLVDCHADMFSSIENKDDDDDGDGDDDGNNDVNRISCPAGLALRLAQQLLQQRIRDTVTLKIGKRNGVGVLLFDTKPLHDVTDNEKTGETTRNGHDDEDMDDDDDDDDDENPARHVHVLLPLDPPGIQQVQTIRACLKGDRNWKEEFAATDCGNSTMNDDDSPTHHHRHRHRHQKAPLQTALEEAIRIFRQAPCVREKAGKTNDPLDTRSIWILTNRDDPYSSDYPTELLQNVARDAKESGIQILVWPLPCSKTTATTAVASDSIMPFSMDPLYGELVTQDVFEGRRLDSVEAIEEGLDDLQQYWKKIRRLYWGPMLLPGETLVGDDNKEQDGIYEKDEGGNNKATAAAPRPHIMVDWFRFVQQAKKPPTVQIDQLTKRETMKLKQYLDKNTGDIFATIRMGDAADRKKSKESGSGLKRIRQFATFGGEQIPMPNEDLEEIRLLANGGKTKPALSIFGFKPKDSIPWYHAMDPAYLIYPNDDVVKGSKKAFVELHAAMLRKNVLAVGEVLHRVHWSSRLVAIYPLKESNPFESDDSPDSVPRSPPGMMVVTLPFEDDIRTLEEDEAWQAWDERSRVPDNIKQELPPDEVPSVDLERAGIMVPGEALVESAINLISRQRLVGMTLGEDFENAALAEFFNYLENVALEIPVPEGEEEFDTRPDSAMILEAVGDQIQDFHDKLPEDIQISKSSTAGTTRKRKKEPVKDETGFNWQDLYLSDELDQVKVPDLKSYLRSVGAPLSGNKSLLVQRVSDLIKKSLADDKVNVKKEGL